MAAASRLWPLLAIAFGCAAGEASRARAGSQPRQLDAVAPGPELSEALLARVQESVAQQTRSALLRVLAERSPDLDEHLGGVSALAEDTARALGLDEHDVRLVRIAAELHDIGKSAIPDAILNKAGPLDADEWELMRRHTLIGERIVSAEPALLPVAKLVRWSHERFDGLGYPDGLAAEQIPLGARIVAVCDAYDAMLSDRVYRLGMSTAEALAELRRCTGTQFDPTVVEAFCSMRRELGAVAQAA